MYLANRFSKRAKELLASYDIQPPPTIVEVDIRGNVAARAFLHILTPSSDDGNVIKHLLTRLTNHSTFPNILIRGKSIGGSDDLQALHSNKSLTKLIEQAGAKARGAGK